MRLAALVPLPRMPGTGQPGVAMLFLLGFFFFFVQLGPAGVAAVKCKQCFTVTGKECHAPKKFCEARRGESCLTVSTYRIEGEEKLGFVSRFKGCSSSCEEQVLQGEEYIIQIMCCKNNCN
ncbi:prostate and testis expressed protein 4-like isoform X1 [Tachyglossus aculeatus]|uniref:prostate and testis expressed protein 4-like isoform X1 n=1 Tax=Tachyglossus aculeatus TaxID=9261 RepID=UPI0018F763F2|nr:prostate and testis expressed protein 4-like isoform X1 [Tachyglossus aculeatus]